MTTYCNRHGDTVTADEALDGAGLLRNGFGLRVPLQMCDSLQRSVAEDAKRRSKTVHRDPMGRELGVSEEEEEEEPRRRSKCDAATGFVDSRGITFAADARMQAAQRVVDQMAGRDEMLRAMWRDGRSTVNEARREMVDELIKGRGLDPTPTGVGSKSVIAARAGDVCMTDDTHEPGHLVNENGRLVCRADKRSTDTRPTYDAAEATEIKRRAWEEMRDEMSRGRSNG